MHLQAYRPQQSTVYYNSPEKQQSIISGRDMTIRDIKTTTGPQMRDEHIRDKLIKDCILLGLP